MVRTGSCLCGAVKYETRGQLRPVIACHCNQCRKLTGHHMAATASLLKDFAITKDEGLKWYASSDSAKRGFCGNCGAQMFWQHNDAPHISITAGTLDDDRDIGFWGHIFCADKGRYYDIPDDQIQCNEKPTDYPVLKE